VRYASAFPLLKALRICGGAQTALQWRMPALTRRRSNDAPQECWHVFFGDVRVGTIVGHSA
jgi:hypothetical protein